MLVHAEETDPPLEVPVKNFQFIVVLTFSESKLSHFGSILLLAYYYEVS